MNTSLVCAAALGLISGFVASPASGQELTGPSLETAGKPISEPAPVEGVAPKVAGISMLAGGMTVGLGPMNDRLVRGGATEKLPTLFPLLGGQGFGLFSRFLIGGSGAGLLSRSVDMPGNREASVRGAWGTVDFGYQLLRVNGFLLAPVVSLGGYGMAVTLASKDGGSFDDVVEDPARSTTLTSKGVLGGVSLLGKVIILGRPSTSVGDARSGLSLGLRVGGVYGIPYRDWKADGVSVSDGPSFGLRGAYAALSLGVGNW